MNKDIIFSKDVQYEIVSDVQIILHHKKYMEYILIDGISCELVFSLISLKTVSYAEFIETYSEKYSKHSSIKEKIIKLLSKLQSLYLITIK